MKIVTPIELVDNDIYDAKGRLVARCWREDVGEILTQKVNSHDALLEACKLLLRTLLENGYDPGISKVKEIAEAAIAQAEK